MARYEEFFNRGVVYPGHDPIIVYGTMKAEVKTLKAGTVLTLADGVFTVVGDGGTPNGVLLDDVPSHTNTVVTAPILLHGMVVKSRLLDYSTGQEKVIGETLAGKLQDAGLYAVQAGWDETDFR